MINYKNEIDKRVAFIKNILESSGMNKIIFANSGGKDAALTGILCKMACEDTIGLILPCGVNRNFTEDKDDALRLASQFSIETKIFDLSPVKELLINIFNKEINLNETAASNISPRLRMIALYALSIAQGRLVAGTSNYSEMYMGYFTKWGDGAYDFNPIGDLTVTEIREFLHYLNVPEDIIHKPPSGGLVEGQTDEGDMGISYEKIDQYIKNGTGSKEDILIINNYHNKTMHKRSLPPIYKN